MATIQIDYNENEYRAEISFGEDCPSFKWSFIRRFFEEAFPTLVENRYSTVYLPWWAFISVRDRFRSILRINNIDKLKISDKAKGLLLEARSNSEKYQKAEELTKSYSEEDVEKALISVGFKRELMPYQKRNVARLCGLIAGATFSVPGAGKTTEALAYYYITSKPGDRILIVAPKNAFAAWEDELLKCVENPGFEFTRLTGGKERIVYVLNENPKAVIISYHQLPLVLNEVASYLIRNSVYMFIDESHKMKRGYEGVQGSAILNLSHLAKSKIILSGTPMPNSQDDLIAQFNFLYPELNAKPDDVIERLRKIFVRTTKSELNLSPPQRIIKNVPMSPAQRNLYEALASDTARKLQGLKVFERKSFRKVAKCVQYMIQAASNPALLINSPISGHPLMEEALKDGLSKKLELATALSRNWVKDGHKVLIWSTFVNTVEHLAGLLMDLGAHYIHGGVFTSEDSDEFDSREAKIKEFNDPDSSCRVLVANPAACSEGISLHHVCHRAIYIDRNYNAAQYLQSEDRIHRIGLKPGTKTYITILCTPDTIDEAVNRRLKKKVTAMSSFLDDPSLNIKPFNLDMEDENDGLDMEDIEDLRRLLKVDT
jgi:SNF2 family DNA or RNA helicase